MIRSTFNHVVNAKEAVKFGIRNAVVSSINQFDISDFGINKAEFLTELAPSFLQLPYDYYDVGFKIESYIRHVSETYYIEHQKDWLTLWNRIGRSATDKELMISYWRERSLDELYIEKLFSFEPHRRRSCFSYQVEQSRNKYEWIVHELGVPNYSQKVSDSRSRNRNWAAPPLPIYRNAGILKLIGIFSQLLTLNPSVPTRKFKFTFHQMLTYAKGKGRNEPAPEGTHQDGADFIVSAIVIEKENVSGGDSAVYYAKDKVLALQYSLRPGEGIFQADQFNNLWHGVSPLHHKNKEKVGYRSIIGFDIGFL